MHKSQYTQTGIILLAFLAFISIGMPDGLLGVAWPSIRSYFELGLDALGLLIVPFTSGFILSSFLSGNLMNRLGIGGTLAGSCFLTAIGLTGYTFAPAFWIMIIFAFILGNGAGAIDAGLNTYVASHFGEGLMQWLHASFGVGITLGPIIMTLGLNNFDNWKWGYSIVGAAQFILALCFFFTIRIWNRHTDGTASGQSPRLTDYKTPLPETLRLPIVWINILMFFLYTGLEVSVGAWIYSILTLSRGVPIIVAGFWAGSYWAMFTIGRVLAALMVKQLKGIRLLNISFLAAIAGSILLWWNPFSSSSILAVTIIGFALAPIFPSLITNTSARVGDHHAANTIGMQISACGVGAAIIPSLAGVIAENYSLEAIPPYLATLFIFMFISFRVASSGKPVNGKAQA